MSTTPRDHSPLTPAVLHVLLALSEGPLHGYAIMQRVHEDSGIAMGPGTVYGSLQRMEEGGLVREREDRSGEGRRLFALTEAGRAALEAETVRMRRLLDLARQRRAQPGTEPA